jgi:hypothetical protein
MLAFGYKGLPAAAAFSALRAMANACVKQGYGPGVLLARMGVKAFTPVPLPSVCLKEIPAREMDK